MDPRQRFPFAANVLDRIADAQRLPEFQTEKRFLQCVCLIAELLETHVSKLVDLFFALHNLNNASFKVRTRDELRLDWKLLRGKLHRLTRQLLINALDLVKHASRFNDRDPMIRSSLARTHTSFRRLLRDRLVREHPDPDLAAAF